MRDIISQCLHSRILYFKIPTDDLIRTQNSIYVFKLLANYSPIVNTACGFINSLVGRPPPTILEQILDGRHAQYK